MKKIKGKIRNIISIYRYFGFSLGCYNFLLSIPFIKHISLWKKINKKYYRLCKDYLYSHYLSDYCFDDGNEIGRIDENSNIWVFWWQGICNAPELVKKCLSTIIKFKGKHNVVIIDKTNLMNYLDVPDFFWSKLENNEISIQHFSDYIRTRLLYKYGGIWMDATLFLTDNVDEDLTKYGFYTIRHGERSDYHICEGKWSTFFMASCKGNKFFKYLADLQEKYWRNEKYPICYLIIDCFISLLVDVCPFCRDQVNQVPVNNIKTMQLAKMFTKDYSDVKESVDEIIKNTKIIKLSNKCKVNMSPDSVYYWLLNVYDNREEKTAL